MAQPLSSVYVGKVPWTSDYSHVRYYDNSIDQYNDIKSQCTYTIPATHYTYIRKDNVIKVQAVAEQIMYCNYVMYLNANFPSLWIYAFIADCRYINDNTAELVLETDIWQTYMFNMNFSKEVFVERCHVNVDTKGGYLLPEPSLCELDHWYSVLNTNEGGNRYQLELLPDTIIIETTADVNYTDIFGQPTSVPQSRKDIYGGVYGGVPHGSAMYAFPLEASSGDDEYTAYRFLWDLNKVGAGDAIVNVFAFPSALLSVQEKSARVGNGTWSPNSGNFTGAWGRHRLPQSYNRPHVTIKFNWPVSYENFGGGEVPMNNKMLTYPFCFMRVLAPDGHFVDWKWESWDNVNSSLAFRADVWAQLSPDANAVVAPTSYAGVTDYNYGVAMTFPVAYRISWINSAYLNWSAQHHIGNMINAAADIALMGVPIPQVKGAAAAVKTLGSGYKAVKATNKVLGGSATRQWGRARDMMNAKMSQASGEISANMGQIGGAAPLLGALGAANLASEISYNTNQPNSSRGSTTHLSMYDGYSNTAALLFLPMFLRGEYYSLYDSFFQMYGYNTSIDRTVPFKNHALWNYVKTINASFTSVILMWSGGNFVAGAPQDAVDTINESLDNGVTFWHTTSGFGNYDTENNVRI